MGRGTTNLQVRIRGICWHPICNQERSDLRAFPHEPVILFSGGYASAGSELSSRSPGLATSSV